MGSPHTSHTHRHSCMQITQTQSQPQTQPLVGRARNPHFHGTRASAAAGESGHFNQPNNPSPSSTCSPFQHKLSSSPITTLNNPECPHTTARLQYKARFFLSEPKYRSFQVTKVRTLIALVFSDLLRDYIFFSLCTWIESLKTIFFSWQMIRGIPCQMAFWMVLAWRWRFREVLMWWSVSCDLMGLPSWSPQGAFLHNMQSPVLLFSRGQKNKNVFI